MNLIDLKSPFASSLVSTLVSGFVRKKLGIDVNVDLSSLVVTDKDNSIILSLAGSIDITKDDIAKIATALMKGGLS